MGSPTIFSGRYTKLLTNKGILNSDGSLNQYDGPVNYVKYAEFEQNVTTGWSLGTTGTLTNAIPTGTPAFGSGASGNLSIATSNVSPIRDNISLRYVSSAATTAGNMLATDALTIDAADQAKVLTFKFYYSVVSNPTNGNFSGTSSNSFGVAIWDVTNSAWIGVAGNFSMTQNSGVGIASGTFQTNSNTSQIRLVIYNANATSGAITLAFDDFFVGPQTAPIGPVVTDWVSYTPTGTWTTNTSYAGQLRRVGDSLEARVRITLTGAPNNTQLLLNLPSGLTIDVSKLAGSNLGPISGSAYLEDLGITGYDGFTFVNTASQIGLKVQDTAGTFERSSIVTSNAIPFAWNNGDFILLDFRVPISGWSSNVQLSNDTDTRVVSAFGTKTSGTHTSTGNWQDVSSFDSSSTSTHGNFNTATGVYTVAVSGDYLVSSNVGFASNSVGFRGIRILKTGGVSTGVAVFMSPTSGAQTNIATSGIVRGLVAGDTLYMQAYQSSGGNLNYATSIDATTNFSISRLSGPSVIAATENVIAKYSTTAGQAITSLPATIVYATREIDSHGIVNTTNGDITIPISGKYLIGVYGSTASATWASGQQFLWQIRKNGLFSSFINQIRAQAAYTGILESVGPTYIDCLAGDVINIQAQSSVATTLRTTAGTNFFYLVRLGN